MNKSEALRRELAKMGIHSTEDLKEAIKKTTLNISLMAAVPRQERAAS